MIGVVLGFGLFFLDFLFDGLRNFSLGGEGVDVEIEQILIHGVFSAGHDLLAVHDGILSDGSVGKRPAGQVGSCRRSIP
ncbi:hypothetical protein CFBP5877_03275 [Agrobacterium tumefaciens]|uniref:Uncharacterized protein n=1 Tax=Agrobacterium tumefaciens TaxID=358 RepID=A0AAE6EFT4_AGRTU|nr:hypothetical protein CFBP5499_03725 [Agrobacterium tumefaciens]QCL80223.1 hypothetical protein CFBP5877_03275 [Agrobacterium tumefaciens]